MTVKPTAILVIILAVCAVLNALAIVTWDVSYITNDGVQYLSTANNWLNGRGFSTDALIYGPHFQGVLPAPQTVWPPGYPFALGLIGSLGVDVHWGGLILNLVTHALAACLTYLILRRMGVSCKFSAICSLLFYLMAMPWSFATGIITEPLFTTLLLSALLILPDPRRSRLTIVLSCGLIMAMAVYVRYSAVFFVAGTGIGLFLYLLMYDRPRHIGKFLSPIVKLGLLMLAPVLAFLHMMYRTRELTGTLDRYAGYREPETLLSTLRIWAASSSELLGLGHGALFSTRVGVTILLIVLCLAAFLLCRLLLSDRGSIRKIIPETTIRFNKALMLVVFCHSAGLVTYLSISSMSDTPLNIVTRYLYQIYPGVYLLFCFVIFCLIRNTIIQQNRSQRLLSVIPLASLITIYLFAQVNELSSSRVHFFEEGRRTSEAMQLTVGNKQTVGDYIVECFHDNDDAVIWSSHGQQVHLHTGITTISHADIFTSLPFTADQISERVATYKIGMFLFIGDQQLHNKRHHQYMQALKNWLINNNFERVAMQELFVRGDKLVEIFIDKSKCT